MLRISAHREEILCSQRDLRFNKGVVFLHLQTISGTTGMLLSVYKILSMKHEFTQLQLTRLVYGETTKAETDMLLELVVTVPQMAENLNVLSAAKDALGAPQMMPSDQVINRIMAYSALTAHVSAS